MNKGLKEFKKSNEQNLDKSQDYFEKQLTYISAGTFGISMFLVEKVVKDIVHSKSKLLLIISWTLLALTLIINLCSHFFAVKFNYLNIEEIDNNTYDFTKSVTRNKTIKALNLITLISLSIGIIMLVLFLILNI